MPEAMDILLTNEPDIQLPRKSPKPSLIGSVYEHCNVDNQLLFSDVSPLGTGVKVYESCSKGVCNCVYRGNVHCIVHVYCITQLHSNAYK